MTWPACARFDRRNPSCPSCGADSTHNGDRVIRFNQTFDVVDGDFVVIFEAACPCGWSDSVTFD